MGPTSNYLLCACLCTFLLSANCVLFPLHDTHVGYCCSWRIYAQFKQGERAGGQLESFPLVLPASRPLCDEWLQSMAYSWNSYTPLLSSPPKNRNFESYLIWMPFQFHGLNGPCSNPGRRWIYVLPNVHTDTAPPPLSKSSTQWVPVFFLGVKRPEREFHHYFHLTLRLKWVALYLRFSHTPSWRR